MTVWLTFVAVVVCVAVVACVVIGWCWLSWAVVRQHRKWRRDDE